MTIKAFTVYAANRALNKLRKAERSRLYQIAPHPTRYVMGACPMDRIFAIRILRRCGHPIGYLGNEGEVVTRWREASDWRATL